MGGHGKWNENQHHHKYSKEEIEAYQVPYRIKAGPCVDTYIPLKKCFVEHPTSFAVKMLDAREAKDYNNFFQHILEEANVLRNSIIMITV